MCSISSTRIKVTRFYTDAAESSSSLSPAKRIDTRPPAAIRPAGASSGWSFQLGEGASKAAMTGIFATGTAAVIGGAISNYRWPEDVFQISDFGPVHLASRHLAKAALELAKCVHQLGRSLGKVAVKGILAALNVIANHPMVVSRMAAVGTVGYLTFCQIALASIEENYTRKAYHLSLATLGAVATLWLSIA